MGYQHDRIINIVILSLTKTEAGISHLFISTTDRPFAPFAATQIYQLLAYCVFWLLRQVIIWTG